MEQLSTYNRRNFLKTLVAASAIALPIRADSLPAYYTHSHTRGILLGTLEKQMSENPDDTLRFLADLGYQTLEFPGTFGHDAAMLSALIKKNHLTSLAGGESMWYIKNNIDTMLKEHLQLGKKYLVCYWPWIDDGKNKTADNWKANCEVFNELGRRCKKEGIKLAYHNHNIEFIITDGQFPYDILLKNTDPEMVTFQMDLWWVVSGGKNPLEYLKAHPGRFELCHIKTLDVFNHSKIIVDYPSLCSTQPHQYFKHYIIENEKGLDDPKNYAAESSEYLHKSLQL